jgi:hypothetical protein
VSSVTPEQVIMNSIFSLLWIRVRKISRRSRSIMARTCANSSCATVRRQNEGKLFRLDIDLGSLSGEGDEYMTEYVWLCGACAEVMHPKVEVTGDTVRLRLTRNDPMRLPVAATTALPMWAN